MASDGFFFDVEKWFGSIAAQRMSFAEKGVYLTMLFQQWREPSKSLPDDPQAVADRIAITDSQIAEVLAAWPVVRAKFEAVERAQGRIQNRVVEKTRRKQAENRRKHVESGRVGGKASAAKRREQRELDAKRRLSDAQANSTDLSRLDRSRSDQATEPVGQPAAERRSDQRPIHQPDRRSAAPALPPLAGYQQLKVWRTFIDRWVERLNGADFDIDGWLLRMDGTLTGVLPSNGRDWWDLLNRQFEAELARRGFTLASSASVPVGPPKGCRHEPACADAAEHTRRDLADRRKVS